MAWWNEPYQPLGAVDTVEAYQDELRDAPSMFSPEWWKPDLKQVSGTKRSYKPSAPTPAPITVQGFATPEQDGGAMDAYKAALAQLASGGGGGGGAKVGGDSTGPLRAMRARIDAEYGALLGRLDEMYQLAETDQERAMIEFALADLDDQYSTAVESIGMVFDQADEQVGGYVDRAQERAAGVGDAVSAEYDRGVERQLEQEAMARALLGERFGQAYRGATSGQTADAEVNVDLTNMAGARESAFQQAVADLSAEDAAWIEAQLGGQRAANTAEAGRLQAQLRNRAVQEHQRQVAARIQQERMARAAAEQGLVQSQLAALSQLAQQESSLRQSDINSRRQAAASGGGDSARLGALAKLAELEAAGGSRVSLPSLSIPRTNPYGIPASALSNDLAILQRRVMEDPSNYNAYAGAFVNSVTEGLDGAIANRATDWLYDLIDPWNVTGATASTAPVKSFGGGGLGSRAQ